MLYFIYGQELMNRDMASPVNRKNPQPQEGTEFPPMDLEALAKQKKV